MNLGVSIANLLRRYPAVGVPGIGVFKRTRAAASYDADQAAFLPPVDRVALVGQLEGGVFSITTYVRAQQQLDEPAAAAKVEAAVREVMESISRNGEALLEGLGYLFADGASFVFKPFDATAFVAKPIPAAPPPATAPPTAAAVPAVDVTDVTVAGGNGEEAMAEEELEADDGAGSGSRMPWVVAAVVAVMLVGVAAAWHYQPAWFNQKVLSGLFERTPETGRPPASQVQAPAGEPPAVAAGIERDSAAAAVDSAQTAAAATPDTAGAHTALADSLPARPSVTYEIIVGSFATMRQANKFVAEMKAKGYDLQALDSRMPGNRKKISWGSFATEEAAYKELARVQKTIEPGAWIAKIEHD